MGEWSCSNVISVPTGHTIQGITADCNGFIYYTSSTADIFSYLWRDFVREYNSNSHSELLLIKESCAFSSLAWIPDNTLIIYSRIQQSIFQYDIDNKQLGYTSGSNTSMLKYLDGDFQDATYHSVNGMVMNQNGDLYATDHNCVRRIDLTNRTVCTVAGIYKQLGRHKDGSISGALFGILKGISVNSHGTVCVCGEHLGKSSSIRKIQNGFVSTIAQTDGTYHCAVVLNDETILASNNGRIELISANRESSFPLLLRPIVDCILMTRDDRCNVFAVSKFGTIYMLENSWKYERFLWIARLKEDITYCPLALLPADVIREISSCLHVSIKAALKRMNINGASVPSKKSKTVQ